MEALAVAILLISFVVKTTSIDLSQCIAPMGMESGSIRNEDITASSSFDHGNVGPHHGRVRTELHGGAWCPQSPATQELKEWLEIDLKTAHMITGSGTQGRFGNGQGVEFSESYMLEYWRPQLSKWIRYRNHSGDEVLHGNFNTYLESKSVLDPPIVASKVRFYPFSHHRRTVCMRVELYGCRWSDGVVSYSMPQGDKRGSWEFFDAAYDGHWDGLNLRLGLGQLTDGKVATDDFKDAFRDASNQGWVGWKNDTRQNGPIEMMFEFDKVREFSAVHLYCNNQFTRDVQVFASARIVFSVGGKLFNGEPLTFDYIEDKIFETPRNVSIKLHHRVGRFVKIQLQFAARWIMLSEVMFDSTVLHGNFSDEIEVQQEADDNDILQRDQTVLTVINSNKQNVVSTVDNQAGMGQYLGVIVGVLSVLAVLMLATVAFIIIQQRRYKSSPRQSQIPDKSALYHEPSLSRLPLPGSVKSDYADVRDHPEYAVPLQPSPLNRHGPPPIHQFLPKPPPIPPPPEQYYATTDICKAGFIPPPPPLSTPPPVRLSRQPRYVSSNHSYVGP